MRLSLFAVCSCTLGLMLACGGGGSSNSAPSPTGTLTLTLGSDSFPGYKHAVVSLGSLDSSTDGINWTEMAAVNTTFDLVGSSAIADSAASVPMQTGLQGGHAQSLLSGHSITPGTSLYFRLNWSLTNYSDPTLQAAYVNNSNGTGYLLAMPAHTVVTGSVALVAGSNQARIMLNGQQAIQIHAIGQGFVFQPTAQALDLANCATITGQLAAGSTSIAGAEVYAETVDGLGIATIQRRALSDASGNYVLDALPTGQIYYVTSQPSSPLCYAAVAGDPVVASAAQTYSAINLGFASPMAGGIVNLSFSPASIDPDSISSTYVYSVTTPFDGTWGELRQNLTSGADSPTLIVRSQGALSTEDTVTFTGIAATAKTYGITAERSLMGAAATTSNGFTETVSATTPSNFSLGF